METRRWVNQSQPQTLYIGTILLYLSAALQFLFGGFASPIGLAFIVGFAVGAYGIANEWRWAYWVAVGLTGFNVALLVWFVARDTGLLFDLMFLVSAIFPVALFLLLVHPHSREYQRIWFS